MPPLRPFLCIQPTPSSVWFLPSSVPHRPSVGKLPTLRLRSTNVLFCFPNPASHMQVCTPPRPVRLVVLGLGVGGGAKETAPPRDGLESFVSSFVARESVPSSTLVFPLDSCGARLSVCLPPSSPFPRTTVLVPLLSLLTGDYFRGRSALPCPAGPGRPAGCFKRVRSPSFSSSPPLPVPFSSSMGRAVP